MDLEEFRESFINEDINAAAMNSQRYPIEVFIDNAVDILVNDYSLLNDISHCFYEFKNGNRAFKSMRIDAGNLDLQTNTLDLLIADYNDGEIKNITNGVIEDKSRLLLNFLENCLKGFFTKAEQSNPAVQLAKEIRLNLDSIYKVHLFLVSTDKLSKYVKTLDLNDFSFNNSSFKVVLDVLDIEKIYRSKMVGFVKEDLIINCEDYGLKGIPCIKAETETDQYDSYLAIVPGAFLSDIYKKYSSTLLESNVRSFLKFNGSVNKGIRGTILNEKSRFFTYNNGISTTAKSVVTDFDANEGLLIKSFTDLQIINGGQTTATLAATNIKNGADLSGIYVQMKLTILKSDDPELIRNIAKYANSQNKVKTADLNSSHPFYVRMEDFSRKVYAPIFSGQLVQQLWFFERARGQYEQPLMQMTKKQRDDYKLVRPKDKKFTLTDLAKYLNAADMLPHYVSWGGEVNAAHFHNNMEEQWETDNSFFNELYYKELIGKKIFFSFVESTVSSQEWYQENRAYRPQLVAYTISKLAFEANRLNKYINFRAFWDYQKVPDTYCYDVSAIAKLVFDIIYDPNRSTTNIETYCKKEECWKIVQAKPYQLSDDLISVLVSKADKNDELIEAKKEQKTINSISDEISIFKKGAEYWRLLIDKGTKQKVLGYVEQKVLEKAIDYCIGKIQQLSKSQIKDIKKTVDLLKENGIE